MKKIIAAAAGLMLVGSVVVASAAVEFSGDARTRYYFEDNYDLGLLGDQVSQNDHWRSRVRLAIKGTTAGGAFVKTKLVIDDDNQWGNSADGDVDFNEAYMGVPMGCFLLTAGRQNMNLTSGILSDNDFDNVRLTWSSEGTTLIAMYAIDNVDVQLATANSGNFYTDSEDRSYVLAWVQDWNDAWTTKVGFYYGQLDLTDTGALVGEAYNDADTWIMTAEMAGQVGPVALGGQIAYQDFATNIPNAITGEDSGFGIWLSAGADFDAFNVTGIMGYAGDGFAWDDDIGFVMIGGDAIITPAITSQVGRLNGIGVDTWFLGVKTTYQATEDFGLGFNLAYADMEQVTGTVNAGIEASVFELSATATYAIADGTKLVGQAGYLLTDIDNNGVSLDDADAFGFGMSLELAF
ncbi:MAG: porin [Desulfotalea sp.]